MSYKTKFTHKPSGVEWPGEIETNLKQIEKEIAEMLEEVTE